MRKLLIDLKPRFFTPFSGAVLVWALFALQAAWSLSTPAPTGQYRRQSWQIDSGLPQDTVRALLQTSDGFLWLATEGGLVRFDGFDFRVFDTSNTPQFRSNFVEGLTQDRAGTLWISTSDGLLRLSEGRFKSFTVMDGLPSNTVTGVYQQRSGRLIVATSAGLAILQGERFREIAGTEFVANAEKVNVLPDDTHGVLWLAGGQQLVPVEAGAQAAGSSIKTHIGSINAISLDTSGDLWVGGTDGVECFHRGQQCSLAEGSAFGKTLALPSQNVTALLAADPASGSGGMWVGTTAGLALVSSHSTKRIGVNEGLADARIQKLFQDRSGALWVISSHGLAKVIAGHVKVVPEQTNWNDVLSVLQDREGDMWFGTESDGVSVLRDQPFSSITARQGLSADFVRTVFQERSGTIWIGTNKGGLDMISGGKISTLRTGALSSSVVLALAETAGDLWVGTPDGLTRIRGGHSQLFTTADGMADNFVRSLYADNDGSLWIGTRNGLSHLSAGRFKTYSTQDGLGSDVIGSILRSGGGDLWVGTLGGLSRLAGGRFVNYTTQSGLGGDAVTALFEDSNGSLWIGSNRSGLTRLREGRFVTFPFGTGLPDTIYGILAGAEGSLWMASPTGVYRAEAAALNAYANKDSGELPVTRYGAADGMQISECSSGGHPSAWRMQDGTLWFATLKGVSWIDPQTPSKDAQPPQIAIEGVMLDNQDARLSSAATGSGQDVPTLVVPPGGERITVHYAGLSFLAPQKVRYRYKLEGFDRGWVQAGSGRTAYYTNVPPGRYRFTVAASNAQGVWSAQPALLQLRVQPRFFQTIWFYLLIGLALIGLAYAVYRIRVRYVEAKFKAVMAERERLAREVHDTLAQGYVGISVQLEIITRLLQTSRSAALDQLGHTKELVRSSLAEARSSIWDLRSHGSDAGILPARIAAAAKSKEQGGAPDIVLQVQGTYRPLKRDVEDQILRIAQEAMNNSVRHANATRIEVTLTFDEKMLLLSVSDNGLGFEAPFDSFSTNGHFGFQGMQERAASIGAVLHVEGRYGQGALVTLRVKMQKEAER